MVLKPGTGSFGTVCRCQVLLENEILHLHKVGQQQEAWSALKLPGLRLCWPWTSENTVDQHQQMTWQAQTITDCGNFTLDLKQRGFCASPTLPPDSGTLISKGNAKFTSIREHNFGPLSSSPVLFVFSPGETLLTLSVVQEWLDTRNATAETHVLHTSVRSGSWSTDSSCSPLFVNLPHIFEWVLFHNPLQGAVISIACTFFLPHLFLPFASLLMCLDTELCEQPASFAMTFCVLPSLCKVSMVVFWTTVKSAVFPMIVQPTELD